LGYGQVSGPLSEDVRLPDPRRARIAEVFYAGGRRGVRPVFPLDPTSSVERYLADQAYAAGVRDTAAFGPLVQVEPGGRVVGMVGCPCGAAHRTGTAYLSDTSGRVSR
jgi:hypothetical protein